MGVQPSGQCSASTALKSPISSCKSAWNCLSSRASCIRATFCRYSSVPRGASLDTTISMGAFTGTCGGILIAILRLAGTWAFFFKMVVKSFDLFVLTCECSSNSQFYLLRAFLNCSRFWAFEGIQPKEKCYCQRNKEERLRSVALLTTHLD